MTHPTQLHIKNPHKGKKMKMANREGVQAEFANLQRRRDVHVAKAAELETRIRSAEALATASHVKVMQAHVACVATGARIGLELANMPPHAPVAQIEAHLRGIAAANAVSAALAEEAELEAELEPWLTKWMAEHDRHTKAVVKIGAMMAALV
jgi:hypothetical protein